MNIGILDLIKKINFSNIISNTNKTLGIIKKSIPVYKQVKPYMTKEKALFKKKEIDEVNDIIKESKPLKDLNRTKSYNDTLTFFN